MYRSFEDLSIRDEAHLRDPQRVRSLNRKRNFGTWIAVALLAPAGLACLALGAAGVYLKLMVASAPPQAGWVLMGVGFFFGLMMLVMARAFYREAAGCALAGYLKAPQRYDFKKGSITGAVYHYNGDRGSAKMLVKGVYGESGLFYEEFDARVWSAAVADRGEGGGLKPGDDWYSEKGKRVSLPLEVWVVCEIGGVNASLAGIPAELAARLAGKRRGGSPAVR